MNRRGFLICLMSAAAALPAAAAEVQDSLVAQLRAQGFTSVDVSTTLLGRVRILASSDTMRREIVLNPGTGEVLRDYQESISLGDEAVASVRGGKDAALTGASGGASGSVTTTPTGSATDAAGSGSHSHDESQSHETEDHYSSEEDHGETDDE